jgi:hypothetical protein
MEIRRCGTCHVVLARPSNASAKRMPLRKSLVTQVSNNSSATVLRPAYLPLLRNALCFIFQIQDVRAVSTRIAPKELSLKTSLRSLRGQPRACPMESCLGSSGQRCIPWSLIQIHGHGTFGTPFKGSLPALPQSISTVQSSTQCRDFARCRPSQRSLFPPFPCKSSPSLHFASPQFDRIGCTCLPFHFLYYHVFRFVR